MNIPLIFCHYGNSTYLPYVFEMARLSNPDKEIVLLGDKNNQWLADKYNITHHAFETYNYGPELDTFNQEYQLIQRANHNNVKAKEDWINFVFKRWFYISNYLETTGIDGFWHFDTDTMILEDLTPHEGKFSSYDCSEQCNGSCLNGYISCRTIVKRYIKKINSLFQDPIYLGQQKEEFENVNSSYAFTEMRAYEEFKKEGLSTIRLNSVINGSTFDDAICQEHNMEMERLPSGKEVKKVYATQTGEFCCWDKALSKHIQMNTLNLSWVPIDLYGVILSLAKQKSLNLAKQETLNRSGMRTITQAYYQMKPFNAYRAKIKAETKKTRRKVRSIFKDSFQRMRNPR